MNYAVAQRQACIFKALMHPVRLQILDLLRRGELCVCQIEEQLGQRQAYISQQLAVLRQVKLVADRREGSKIYYRIIEPRVLLILDAARAIVGDGLPRQMPLISSRCSCDGPNQAVVEPSLALEE